MSEKGVTSLYQNDDANVLGMGIEYQMPLSPNGQGIGFRISVDLMLPKEQLDEVLDRVSNAARRLSYIEELPRTRHLLRVKEESLDRQKKDRAAAVARQEAYVRISSVGKRKDVEPRPADVSAIAQFDAKITDTEQEIGVLKARIPYLEGYLEGRLTALDDPAGASFAEAAE